MKGREKETLTEKIARLRRQRDAILELLEHDEAAAPVAALLTEKLSMLSGQERLLGEKMGP